MLGKTILVAVVTAILASIVTTLVMSSLGDDRARVLEVRLESAEKRAVDAEDGLDAALDRIDRYEGRVERVESGLGEAQRAAAAAVAASGAETTGDGAALTAPDGSPYLSRAEVESLLTERGVRADGSFQANRTPVLPKSLADVADEMGLTASQEDTVRAIMRDGEQEIINRLFGNRSIEDVRAQILRAKEDPDLQAEMINTVAMRAVGNLGYLATHQKRQRRALIDALGEEQASELLRRPIKPVLGDEFEDVFEGMFD